jgi:hypothetical protein
LTWAAQLFRKAPEAVPVARRLSVRVDWTSTTAVAVCLILTVLLSVAPSLALGLIDQL